MQQRALWLGLVVVLSACGASTGASAPANSNPPVAESSPTESSPTESSPTESGALNSIGQTPTTEAVTGGATADTDTTAAAIPFATLPDVAAVSAEGRVVTFRDGAVGAVATGIIAADNVTMISTSPGAAPGSTTVSWVTLATGVARASVELDGELTVHATDSNGLAVALTRPNPADPAGTEVVVANRQGEVFRRAYASELLPEGFGTIYGESIDAPIGMFVIEYLEPPDADPTAPRRYRVRVLDTDTGELGLPQNLRVKGETVDEDMLGFSRTHVSSRANGLLFTLYRGLDTDDSNYAFVHTLGFFAGVWCLDLPGELWLERLPGAITLTDDEETLVVASANGYVTEFEIADILGGPDDPAPERTVHVWSSAPNAPSPALATNGATMVVGQGADLRWIDAESLVVSATQSWDMSVEAVALLDDDSVLAAGTRRISRITPGGQLIGEAYLPDDFGPVSRLLVIGQD